MARAYSSAFEELPVIITRVHSSPHITRMLYYCFTRATCKTECYGNGDDETTVMALKSKACSIPGAAARSAGVTSPHSPYSRVSTSPLVAPRARGGGSGAHASTESPRASTTLAHTLVTPSPLPVPRGKPSSLDSTKTASSPESDSSIRSNRRGKESQRLKQRRQP